MAEPDFTGERVYMCVNNGVYYVDDDLGTVWWVQCDCGCIRAISSARWQKGYYSCGCTPLCSIREYTIWSSMLTRCFDKTFPGYNRYGGRGITVCDTWRTSFRTFIAHVGMSPTPEHQIDRIDNNGNYEPGNVRWATRKEQGRNKSNNAFITFNGRTQCKAAWAEEYGISNSLLITRLNLGWDVEKALTTPVRAADNEIIGQTFGRLTIESRSPGRGWRAKCECGGYWTGKLQPMRSGKVKSCNLCRGPH